MSGRSSRGGRGDGRAPWRRWCGGRLGADDRLGDLRAFLFDGATDLEGLTAPPRVVKENSSKMTSAVEMIRRTAGM